MIGSRTNFAGESMKRLAGSTLVGEAHDALPLTYMIVEIVYGKTLPIGQQGNRDDFSEVRFDQLSHKGRFRQDPSMHVPSEQRHRSNQSSTCA